MIDIVTDAIKDHHTLYALIIGFLFFIIIITQSKHAGKLLNVIQKYLDNRKINYDALIDTVSKLKIEMGEEKALRYKLEAELKVNEQLRIQQDKTIHDLHSIIKDYAKQAEKK